ncbi:hypothetical protein NQ315_003212, partial [Exocentrus adspersus]
STCNRKKKKNKKRRYWVHPLNTRRIRHSQFYLLRAKLRAHPDNFFDYYRMSIKTFDELLDKVRDKIKKQNTWMRVSIDAEERLTITLRFLATGKIFETLKFDYFIGSRTVSSIVKETCQAIWDVLQPLEMKPPSSKERWLEIADNFYERTNFPNVVGAVDRKHIRLISPMYSGSNYYNYKNYFSIVLLAVVDSDYRFIAIDVGSYGRENSDKASSYEYSHIRFEGPLSESEKIYRVFTNSMTGLTFLNKTVFGHYNSDKRNGELNINEFFMAQHKSIIFIQLSLQ